ncbi:MAG: hypothetical protein JOZ14_14385 [Acidobacteria bacterium]|nr:hypothetical protein [Acidobacteriota bacterium]
MLQPATFLLFGQSVWLLATAGIFAGAYLSYCGSRHFRRKRMIAKTPAAKIESASMGLVEISGYASGPYVVIGPFEGSEGYYCRSVVWELRQRGQRNEWAKLAEETLHVPFYIDDSTDKLLLDPQAAKIDVACNFERQYNCPMRGGQPMPAAVKEFLLRHGVSLDRHVKVEEYSIKPSQFVFALGTLAQNPGLDVSVMPPWAQSSKRDYEDQPVACAGPEIVRLSAQFSAPPVAEMSQQQRIAAALMKAGISSPSAWGAPGGEKSTCAALAEPASRGPICLESPEPEDTAPSDGFDLHPPVVMIKGSQDSEFIISSTSPRASAASLGWKYTLMLCGGPAITMASIFWLIALLAGL